MILPIQGGRMFSKPEHLSAEHIVAAHPIPVPPDLNVAGLWHMAATVVAQAHRQCTTSVYTYRSFSSGERLCPEKGTERLLNVFKRLSAPQLRLQIYGDGHLRASVQKAARADSRITYGGVFLQTFMGYFRCCTGTFCEMEKI